MSCVAGVTTSGQLVTQVVGVCGLAYGRGGAALRSAAQSAASQSIAHLVRQLSKCVCMWFVFCILLYFLFSRFVFVYFLFYLFPMLHCYIFVFRFVFFISYFIYCLFSVPCSLSFFFLAYFFFSILFIFHLICFCVHLLLLHDCFHSFLPSFHTLILFSSLSFLSCSPSFFFNFQFCAIIYTFLEVFPVGNNAVRMYST